MKKIKALIVLTMAFGAITFSSCKKDKQNPTVTASITADVDGTATTFNVHAIAGKGTVDGGTFTTVSGSAANGNVISITLTGTVAAGKTYCASTTPDQEPLLSFSVGSDQFLNDDSSSNKVSVTINSVSSSSISGTFTGGIVSTNILVGGGNTPATKSITNGKFNVSVVTSP